VSHPSLREINPAAGLGLVFPVPLDHVSRLLLHCLLLFGSLRVLSIPRVSRRKLAELLALRENDLPAARLAFVFPVPLDHVSRLLLHCFLPACFFVTSVLQAALAENSPESLN
jgi:hypothetical protein